MILNNYLTSVFHEYVVLVSITILFCLCHIKLDLLWTRSYSLNGNYYCFGIRCIFLILFLYTELNASNMRKIAVYFCMYFYPYQICLFCLVKSIALFIKRLSYCQSVCSDHFFRHICRNTSKDLERFDENFSTKNIYLT
jgi:hypothetical protein